MNAATETGETIAVPAAAPHEARPFYWSLRRELWESRSLIIAPLVAAGVIVLAILLALIGNASHLSEGIRHLASLPVERQHGAVSGIYFGIGFLVIWVTAVTVFFYALDALHSERRDRSILFWKSMPVSDTTVVLSKLFTATVVASAIAFVCAVVAQFAVLLIATVVLLLNGASIVPIWTNLQLVQLMIVTLYTLLAVSLWYAPVTAWVLLVSAWSKRSTFLWAVLPPAAVLLFEKIAFGTSYVGRMLEYRLQDGVKTAFAHGGFLVEGGALETKVDLNTRMPQNALQVLDPIGFLSNPWLWVGLVAAAGLVLAAIWMRRYREPI